MIDERPYMVLEWIVDPGRERTSLDYWLKQRGPLPLLLALDLAADICRGLIHANRQWPGFVHRDLKPGNILITKSSFRIIDYRVK
jgi:serine/threonine protein kinase